MPNFPIPPTYALPIEEDKTTKATVFSPVWLRWFLDFSNTLTRMGFTIDGGLNHNSLAGVQGGETDQYYHLSEQSQRYLNTQWADGIILRDTGATPNYWRITINSAGVLQTTNLGATPP